MRAAGTAARVTRPPRPTRRPLPRARPAGFPPVEPVKAGEAQPAAASKASKTQALRESMKEVRPRWRPPCKLVGRTPPSAAMRAANPDCQRQPKSLASPPPHQPPPHGPSPPAPPGAHLMAHVAAGPHLLHGLPRAPGLHQLADLLPARGQGRRQRGRRRADRVGCGPKRASGGEGLHERRRASPTQTLAHEQRGCSSEAVPAPR
jgi:hypothetical protein